MRERGNMQKIEKELRKAQSEIITTVLIILLVLAAIIIVWTVVKRTVVTGTEGIGTSAFTTNLEIQDVRLWVTGGAEIKVKRGAGAGEINSLKFIFEKADGETEIITRKAPDYEMPDELETKVYDFSASEINEKIEKVSVAPMFGSNAGIEVKEENPEKNSVNENSGLVSWWKFEGNAKDSIGNNDGICSNCPVYENGAAVFDGNSNEITTTGTIISTNQDFTITAFFKADSWSSAGCGPSQIVANGQILMGPDGGTFYWSTKNSIESWDGVTRVSVSVLPEINKWYFIVGIRENNYVKLYMDDGVYIGQSSGNNNGCAIHDIRIGTSHCGGATPRFNGTIDDVMLFNKALSAEEIKAVYNNQKK